MSRGIPRPKVDTIDLPRLRESSTESKKSEEAGSEGQETSHSGRIKEGRG